MKTIWLVFVQASYADDCIISGIYDSEEKANKECEIQNRNPQKSKYDTFWVEEHDVK